LEKPLKIDGDFTPCPIGAGDELFPHGIFVFNITRLIEYIQSNPESVALEEVAVSDCPRAFSSIKESHVESVEVSKPVILAEICPGRYNLIDGHHRMEKARRMGNKSIQAYKLSVHRHIRFLINEKGYVAYVEYWNSKLKGMGKVGRSNIRKNRRTKRLA